MTSLEKELYNIANEMVGNVGQINIVDCSIEPFVEFVYIIDSKQKADNILNLWRKWILSYIAFAKNCFHGNIKYLTNNPTIYWQKKPEITDENYKAVSDIADVNSGKYMLYSRLLITKRVYK